MIMGPLPCHDYVKLILSTYGLISPLCISISKRLNSKDFGRSWHVQYLVKAYVRRQWHTALGFALGFVGSNSDDG